MNYFDSKGNEISYQEFYDGLLSLSLSEYYENDIRRLEDENCSLKQVFRNIDIHRDISKRRVSSWEGVIYQKGLS